MYCIMREAFAAWLRAHGHYAPNRTRTTLGNLVWHNHHLHVPYVLEPIGLGHARKLTFTAD